MLDGQHTTKSDLRFNKQLFLDFWTLFKPYWVSEEKNKAFAMLLANVACTLIGVWTFVKINEFNKDFYDALGRYDKAGILTCLGQFTIYVAMVILSYGFSAYLNMRLGVQWQRWLTKRYQQKWLAEKVFYHIQLANKLVDNPDQRINEDIQQFTVSSLSIFFSLFQSVLTLASFGIILWGLSGTISFTVGSLDITIPGYLCWSAFLFAAVGTYIMTKIGRKQSQLNYQQQKYSADFRYSLVRIREYSEQIAIAEGEAAENQQLDRLFSRIYLNFLTIASLQRNLSFFSNGYNNVAGIAGILFSLPLYLAKKTQLGGLMQIAGAFSSVITALSVFINSFYQLTEWRAVIHRLTEFNDVMNRLQPTNQKTLLVQRHPQPNIVVQQVNLTTPQGKGLISDINLVLEKGQSTLLCGPSGFGKSTLLRAIAGIWTHGTGIIEIPEGAKLLFLPQKPYLPLGALKDALAYPQSAPEDKVLLTQVLSDCQLDKFQGHLNDVSNWSQTLSLGEQQLLAFGRILLHKPDIIFLDESTSALDEESERQIYQTIRSRLPDATIISVGHRSSLKQYHDKVILLSSAADELDSLTPVNLSNVQNVFLDFPTP